MANIAYMRVSTAEQKLDRQENAFRDLKIDKEYKEKITGKSINRPELLDMLEYVREGDVLYVESISRLGRNLRDLLDIVDELNNKGVGLISLKENFIDTTTPQGRLIFNIFATLSEFERDSIKARQKEGIEIAKSNGVYLGRKKKIVEFDETFKKQFLSWKTGNLRSKDFMSLLSLKSNTFYRRMAEAEEVFQIKL